MKIHSGEKPLKFVIFFDSKRVTDDLILCRTFPFPAFISICETFLHRQPLVIIDNLIRHYIISTLGKHHINLNVTFIFVSLFWQNGVQKHSKTCLLAKLLTIVDIRKKESCLSSHSTYWYQLSEHCLENCEKKWKKMKISPRKNKSEFFPNLIFKIVNKCLSFQDYGLEFGLFM